MNGDLKNKGDIMKTEENKSLCNKCGLPKELCVCAELKKGRIKQDNSQYVSSKDDFIYCHRCGCYHYPGDHRRR